jgi:hypothetical protein
VSDTTHQGWTNKETYLIHYFFGDYFQDFRDQFPNCKTFVEEFLANEYYWPANSYVATVIKMFHDRVNWAELDDHYFAKEEA